MRFNYNDGGRRATGFKGDAGDCCTRAIAIATGLPYQEVYDLVNAHAQNERASKRRRGQSSARSGVHGITARKIMAALGWRWVPCMGIGTGCTVHMRPEELPRGRLVVFLSKHYAAVIDGELHDTFDCTRFGTRCVYAQLCPLHPKPYMLGSAPTGQRPAFP